MDRICFSTSIFVVVSLTLLMPSPAGAAPRSDFDDGTLQGWTRLEPFNGNLSNPGSGGNPGGFMKCEDTMPGGGGLYAVAPPEFTGNLSCYTGIQWDEYLYNCNPGPNLPTYPMLFAVIGGDTTVYHERAQPVGPLGVWQPRYVPFTADAWELSVGTASFEEVLANVTKLYISMDCNSMCRDEAGVDNVELLRGAPPYSDFDDGTLQGWTGLEPFNGNLSNPGSGGNPGGFMKCEDTMPGGGGLAAVAPPEFTGNLSCYTGIQWDEYLYDCNPDPSYPTFPLLFAVIGGDTTIYHERAQPVGPLGVWQPRSVPFTASAWELYVGTASFEEVLANVTELRISMECNSMCRDEAGVDNIGLATSSPSPLPDPAHCTVAPWDGRTNAFVTPGNQSNVDQLTVTVCNESGLPLAAMPVEIVFTDCEVCLDSGDAGLRGTTNAAGSVTLRPRAGGCDECAVRVYAGDVLIRNFTRFVSTDWDGMEADGVVNARDAQYVQTALMTGDLCADFDGNGMVNIADLSIFMVSLNAGDSNAAGCATAAMGEEVVAPPAAAPRLALIPNPVRQGAPVEITFQVAGSSSLRLEVFTVSGRHVATLVDGRVAAGIHRRAWETRDPASGLLATGVYFLRLSGDAGRVTQKFVVLR